MNDLSNIQKSQSTPFDLINALMDQHEEFDHANHSYCSNCGKFRHLRYTNFHNDTLPFNNQINRICQTCYQQLAQTRKALNSSSSHSIERIKKLKSNPKCDKQQDNSIATKTQKILSKNAPKSKPNQEKLKREEEGLVHKPAKKTKNEAVKALCPNCHLLKFLRYLNLDNTFHICEACYVPIKKAGGKRALAHLKNRKLTKRPDNEGDQKRQKIVQEVWKHTVSDVLPAGIEDQNKKDGGNIKANNSLTSDANDFLAQPLRQSEEVVNHNNEKFLSTIPEFGGFLLPEDF